MQRFWRVNIRGGPCGSVKLHITVAEEAKKPDGSFSAVVLIRKLPKAGTQEIDIHISRQTRLRLGDG